MSTGFEGKVVLVTGAGRGQGRSHAVAFAERGADVVICDRCADSEALDYPLASEADLAQTEKMITALGRRCLRATVNTADRNAMEALVQRADSAFGGIDIAVANAGVVGMSPIDAYPAALWEEVIASNLTGVFNTLAAVAPGMIARRYGRIITTSSMLGRTGGATMTAYSASKWGVIGMTKSVALELAPHNITVNAIAPGNVATPMVMNDAMYRKFRPDLEQPSWDDVAPVLAGKIHVLPIAAIESDQVSRIVLFLAADASAHMTGLVIPIDAGAAANNSA
ncbi:mycofactocin-coupled SDR family oxidoreductase [Nocardia sp. NPDC059177]|uniref:mycofactocin-coupled SDR family oxidoreductase n=1 Tax=Nocardia sp. NPDC059177 TaxID=3346759 RepID=UPI0036A6DEC2